MSNRLELVVEVDTNRANASIKSVNSSLSSMEAAALKTARGASSGIDSLTMSIAKGAAAANALSGAFEQVVGWMQEQIVEVARLAARIETLAVVNAQLARANGYSEGSIERLVERVKTLGITTQAARHIVNQMIAAQLDLSKATDLARLAQDAAVVAGQDSSQALQGIMAGITTQQIEVLRTYGINIQFERAFTEARRRLGRDLTDIERRNLALNVVLAEGPKIAGAYEASLGTVGKQLGSLTRHIEEAKAAIGTQFLPEMRKMVEGLTELAQWVRQNSDALAFLAKGIAAAAIGAAVAQFVTWLGGARKAVDALTLALLRNPFTAIAVGAMVAGTAIYEMNQRTLEAQEDLFGLRKAADDTRRIMEAVNLGKTVEELKKMGYSLDQVREAMFGGKRGAKEFFDAFDNDEFRKRMSDLNRVGIDAEEARKRKAEAEALAKDIGKHQITAERESAQAVAEARRGGLTGFAREMAQVGDQAKKWATFTDDKGVEHQAGLTKRAWQNVIDELAVRWTAFREKSQRETREQLSAHLHGEEEAANRRLALESAVYQKRLEYNEEIARRNLDHLGRVMGLEEQSADLSRDERLRALESFDAQTLDQKAAIEAQRAQIEIDHIGRVHEIRMRMFGLETSTMLMDEEANMARLGYRADEIKVRIAELTVQRDEIKRASEESTGAAIDAARENAANRTAEMVRAHNRQIFDTFKRQAEGVFDALLTRSQSIWSAIGNSLKTALLTAIKDVVTSRVAALLMQLFTGTRVALAGGGAPGGGALGRHGGLLGAGAVPVFGGGAAGGGGTPPFIPARGGGWGGHLGGWKDFLGFGGGVQYAPGKAATWEAATMGQKLSALGRSDAALAGGAALGLMGLYRGGWSGLGMTTAGGAMIGYKYGGPLGAAIGAGIGAVAGLVRLFVKGAQDKAREKIKATYGVDISDKHVLKQIVDIARQGFGGNLDMAIRSQQIRDLVELYALSTGHGTSGLPATMRPAQMLQQGGSLFQQSAGGLTLDRIGGGLPSAAAPTVINITVPGAKEFFEKETVRVVVENPRAVQSAAMTATRQNAGRREMTGLQLSPGLIVS